jgi:hypothetical protein
VISFGTFVGTVNNDGTTVTGTTPSFCSAATQEYDLLSTSAARNAGRALDPAIAVADAPLYEYVKHLDSEARPVDATYDIGAFEYALPAEVSGLTIDPDRRTLRWSGLPGARSYDVVRGDLGNLRSGGTSASCAAMATAVTTADDPAPPPPGGFWYLVRGSDCGGLAGTLGVGHDAPFGAACP